MEGAKRRLYILKHEVAPVPNSYRDGLQDYGIIMVKHTFAKEMMQDVRTFAQLTQHHGEIPLLACNNNVKIRP